MTLEEMSLQIMTACFGMLSSCLSTHQHPTCISEAQQELILAYISLVTQHILHYFMVMCI